MSPPRSRTPPKRGQKAIVRKAPLKRSEKGIARYTELPRSTKRIPSRRKDPSKRRYASHRCQPYLDWLKLQPCVVTGKRTGEWVRLSENDPWGHAVFTRAIVDPAHIIPRGRGSDDLYNCASLARHLHEEQEKRTDAFNAEHGVDLWALAKQQTEEWLRTAEGEAWQHNHGKEVVQ